MITGGAPRAVRSHPIGGGQPHVVGLRSLLLLCIALTSHTLYATYSWCLAGTRTRTPTGPAAVLYLAVPVPHIGRQHQWPSGWYVVVKPGRPAVRLSVSPVCPSVFLSFNDSPL